MRKLLLVLSICLLPLCVWAWGILPISGGVVSISCSDADLICESFEGPLGPNSEYDLSGWTETTTGGTIDAGATHSGSLSCTDKGSDAYDIDYSTPASPLNASYDLGSEVDPIWIHFYFYLTSESINAFSNAYFMEAENGADANCLDFRINDNNGNYKFKLTWHDVGVTGPTITQSSTFNLNTWYRVGIKYDNGNDIVELWFGAVGGAFTKVAERTSENAPDRSIRYIRLGDSSGIGSYAIRYQLDNVKLDNDTMPGPCP
jgi:hypothetical protein